MKGKKKKKMGKSAPWKGCLPCLSTDSPQDYLRSGGLLCYYYTMLDSKEMHHIFLSFGYEHLKMVSKKERL